MGRGRLHPDRAVLKSHLRLGHGPPSRHRLQRRPDSSLGLWRMWHPLRHLLCRHQNVMDIYPIQHEALRSLRMRVATTASVLLHSSPIVLVVGVALRTADAAASLEDDRT